MSEATAPQAARKYIDCREFPSDTNCSLRISGSEDEVLAIATQHASVSHGHEDSPELKEKLRARIAQLLAGEAQVPDEKIVIEASFLADRLDCTEEAVRLRSHCDQFLKLAASPEPAGRKLNFLVQEMNREVNTIGSKSNDVDIAREVIVLKEEIEVIREQVQNIE